jgi:two-component system, response regulator
VTDNGVEILLVEDNPNDIELTLHAFRRHNLANRIRVARDGVEALEFIFGAGREGEDILTSPPRVVLLDLKLPKINGLEVLQRLKSDPRTRVIPVVMLTASREERDVIESYQLGVNSYIIKPIDFDQFVSAMRTLGMYWLLLNQPPAGLVIG